MDSVGGIREGVDSTGRTGEAWVGVYSVGLMGAAAEVTARVVETAVPVACLAEEEMAEAVVRIFSRRPRRELEFLQALALDRL